MTRPLEALRIYHSGVGQHSSTDEVFCITQCHFETLTSVVLHIVTNVSRNFFVEDIMMDSLPNAEIRYVPHQYLALNHLSV